MYVAGNRQVNVKRDGKLVSVNPGEPVPEAAEWPHDVLQRCMKIGQIVNAEPAKAKSYQLVTKLPPAAPAKQAKGKSTSKPTVSIGKTKKAS